MRFKWSYASRKTSVGRLKDGNREVEDKRQARLVGG